MKVLAIRGKNLASLEDDFEINFTVEPLLSAGIFAITGSTGSGKSTILDALCLALFDDTPRTSQAAENNVQIVDVKGKTINQRDSRNILRRGTGEGYAEVDFISLGGEKFRSRWSVRRSWSKVDGALQNTEFKLVNLTTGIEEQGRKNELLARVVSLIGLTFNQFTRAVLLAQGDFATFLKATQREKAELLEKLTGTEIYSRISAAIYDNSKKAEEELNMIRERIKDVELLSEEDLITLTTEKQEISQEIEILKKEIDILTNKIKWIADESTLIDSVKKAEQILTEATTAIEGAKPRYDYLSQIDRVQEIRDDFNELKTSDKLLAENKSNLVRQEKLRDENTLLLKQSTDKVALYDENLLQHNKDYELIEPQIKQARKLDILIAGATVTAEAAEKEFKQVEANKRKVEKSIAGTQASITSAKETISTIERWFDKNQKYKIIIPRVELIVNLLDDAAAAIKQEANNAKTLAESQVLLDNETAKIAELTIEAQRLDRLLPAEIASLRTKLEEGKPCPVCGSQHHPYGNNINGESLEEEELNKAKRDVADRMIDLMRKVENLKNENIRLASVIENYARQSKDAMDKLIGFLTDFPDWKIKFEQGSLQKQLKSEASTWSKNEVALNNAKEQLAALQINFKHANEQLIETGEVFVVKEEKHKKAETELFQLLGERKDIFEGKTANEVEKQYAQKRKELMDNLSGLKEEKNELLVVQEKRVGVINQICQEIARLSERCSSLQDTVDKWILLNNQELTTECLMELLAKDNAWIRTEREGLNRLQQDKTTALATLTERKKTHEVHHQLECRPAEEETRDSLQEILTEKQEKVQQETTRNTEIDVRFMSHNNGKAKIALFEKELAEKSALSENWKKLNELFGSADGAKFKVLAQGYTLDALLTYANIHLRELSKRYEIQRIPGTLALQVIDLDMLGEIRTVHSLSGGESFLISLALALGLSSLSSNRIKVESLFIDEGFGSLDIDTLRIAMDALERLQTQGRKIGVISHVAEMTECIHAQIQVEKQVNGRSKIKISGL